MPCRRRWQLHCFMTLPLDWFNTSRAADAALNNGDPDVGKGAALELAAGRNSQGLKNTGLEHEAAAKQKAKYHVLPTVDGSIYSGR